MPMLTQAEALAHYQARRTGPLRDAHDVELKPGQYVYPTGLRREEKAQKWPIWEVKQGAGDKLKLVAYGGALWLPVTRERSLNLAVFVPSSRVQLRDYPEEWAWWRASGWHMYAEDSATGGAMLHTHHQRGTLWGANATPEQAATPAAVRQFLTESLYYHLHPRRSRKLFDLTGRVCTDELLAAFIRGQRRKVGGTRP